MKQTHDKNLAESLSTITEKLTEVKESTQKLGESFEENNIPHLATANDQNELPIESIQNDNQPGVISDTGLENTSSNMKKQKWFLKIEERANVNLF